MLWKYSTLFTSFIRLTVTASALHLQRAGATWLQVAQELCLITAYVPVTFIHSHKILLSAPNIKINYRPAFDESDSCIFWAGYWNQVRREIKITFETKNLPVAARTTFRLFKRWDEGTNLGLYFRFLKVEFPLCENAKIEYFREPRSSRISFN